MATKAATVESSIGRRTIDGNRFERACTESMTVAFDGAGVATVEHGEQTYEVELESGHCECKDYEIRGARLICKHVLRASLAALYAVEQRNTALVARVARFACNAGCAYDVAGCHGPTTTADRLGGLCLPCPGCCDAVRANAVDEWTVWQRLTVSQRQNAGCAVATDGGVAETDLPEITHHVEPEYVGGERYARCEGCCSESIFGAARILHNGDCRRADRL